MIHLIIMENNSDKYEARLALVERMVTQMQDQLDQLEVRTAPKTRSEAFKQKKREQMKAYHARKRELEQQMQARDHPIQPIPVQVSSIDRYRRSGRGFTFG